MLIDDFCSTVLSGDHDYKITANLNYEPISLSSPSCNEEIKKILNSKGYKGTLQMSEYLRLKYSEHSTMPEHVKTTTRTEENIFNAKKELLKSMMKWLMDKLKFPITEAQLDCYGKQLIGGDTKQDLTVAHYFKGLVNQIHIHAHDRPHHHDHHQVHPAQPQTSTHHPPQVPLERHTP